MQISDDKIEALKDGIAKMLEEKHITNTITVKCDNRAEWSITLKVGKKGSPRKTIEEVVEGHLKAIGVEDDRMVYFEDVRTKDSWEWYFTHPETPKSILDKQDREIEEEERQEDRENIRRYEEHRKTLRENGLIIKPRKVNSKSTELFYVMSGENFRDIESGEKTVEYRTYNPYHVDKCLGRGKDGIKTLVFQLGYGGPGHAAPKKIRYESEGIYLCDDTMEEVPAFKADGSLTDEKDLPEDFIPMLLAIHIGKKLD